MTVMSDIIAASFVPVIFAHHGSSVTYTPISTGVGASITAVADPPVTDGGALGVDGPDRANRRFLVRVSEVAQPEGEDTIVDSYGTWHVNQDGIKLRPGDTWLLTCSRAHPYPAVA